MRKLNVIGVLGAVLLLAGFTGLAVCPPGSVRVGPGEVLADINAALGANETNLCLTADQNHDGATDIPDIVSITAEHTGITLTLTGQMDIVGRNVTIKNIRIAGNSSIVVDSDGVTISNVTFLGAGNPVIQVDSGMDHTITGNLFANTGGPGILVAGGINTTIANNDIRNNVDGRAIEINTGIGHVILRNRINNTGAMTVPIIETTVTEIRIEDNTVTSTGNANGASLVASFGAGTLIRNNQLNITGAGNNPVGIRAEGPNSIVELNRVDMGGTGNHAIFLDATGIRAHDNVVNNTRTDGFRIGGAAVNAVVERNTISGAGRTGITAVPANVTIIDNSISGTTQDGMEIRGPNNVVRNNTIDGAGVDGIWIQNANATNSLFEGNRISNSGTHGVNVGAAAPNNTFDGNTIVNSGTNGIDIAFGAVNLRIVNNIIERSRGGTIGADDAGISITAAASNALIENNTIFGGASFGVRVNDPGALNARIIGNTVEQNRATGIYVRQATNVLIEDNTVRSNGSDVFGFGEGIALDSLSDTSIIRGNTVTSTAVLTVENRGIRVGGVSNITLEGNTVENNQGTLDIGIIVDVGTTLLKVRNNTITNMREVGLAVTGGSTALGIVEVTGNTLENNAFGIEFRGGRADVSGCNVITLGAKGLHVVPGMPAGNFTVSGNDITSPIRVRNRGVGTLVAENNWWGSADGPPAHSVFGNVDFEPWATSPCSEPDPEPGVEFTYGAASGWYLVSVPTTGDTRDIFGVTMWRYNPGIGDYDRVTTLRPAEGYWARLSANKSVTALGTVPTDDVSVTLGQTGWHQISAPWQFARSAIRVTRAGETLSWADAVAAGWVRNTIYAYRATDGEYTMPTMLQPWYGYWVRAYEDGVTLRFSYTARAAAAELCVSCQAPAPLALSVPSDLPGMPQVAEVAAGALAVAATPNPLSGGAVSFQVAGPLASDTTEIKVQVMDVSGRAVFEGSAVGAQLSWNAEGVANGVYLFQVTAKVAGSWVTSGYEKLLIVR